MNSATNSIEEQEDQSNMGDDLGSDDEFLTATVASLSDDDDDEEEVVAESGKRKSKDAPGSLDEEQKSAKKKKKLNPKKVLVEAGKHLEQQSPEEQATYLTTALNHIRLMTPTDPPKDTKAERFLPRHFVAPKGNSLKEKLQEAISFKKLKKWKKVGSPCVVIVCLSARRAVAILKELVSLKVRAAKLFPKNGSLEQQQEQLASTSFGIAVGTPHRLAALTQGASGEDKQNLSFDSTQLVILDCELSAKQFTVVSLPDTAPHCMALLVDSVLPELTKRSNIHLAFV